MKHTSKNLLLVAAASVTALTSSDAWADTTLLTDNFNSANNASVSAGIGDAGRQTGVFANSGYVEGAIHTISGNTLSSASGTSTLATSADFKAAITDPSVTGFTVSFDAAHTGSNWFSPYLSTHPGDERANSQFGLRMESGGTVVAHGTIGGANAVSRSDAQLDALLGSFDVTASNTYALVATTTSTTTGTYDVFINGTEVMSNIAYALGTGGANSQFNWEEIHPGGASATFDNLSVTTESSTTVIYSDNFNSANNASVSAGINDAGRQSGLLATDDYSESGVHTISSGQLVTSAPPSDVIATDADFTGALTDPLVDQFTLSFDAANTGTNWISPYLSTHNAADERGNSEFGLLISNSGNVTAYATGTNQSITNAEINAALGSFDVSQMNSYALVADVNAGTYDLLINGTEVLSDIAYAFGAGGTNGEINWQNINITGGVGVYDNLLLTTATFATAVPEPSAFVLFALGLLGSPGVRRRRQR